MSHISSILRELFYPHGTLTGAVCPQPIEVAATAFPRYPVPDRISEDCLFLNVYTPAKPATPQHKRPVMIWIHGGGFLLGTL